jgi:pyridinium-3,5-biscarboxylic acid mononucleotide sulfurtransferase
VIVDMHDYEISFIRLKEWFSENTDGRVVVALSGGVDSAVVALAAKHTLQDNALAITANYKTLAESEMNTEINIAKEIGIRHIIIEYSELDDPKFIRNDNLRCYYCRKSLSEYLLSYSKLFNISCIVDGTNVDDLMDYRPGIKALREYRIKSPLLDIKIEKHMIRKIAKNFGLSISNKPSNSCLASRIPYGKKITQEKLTKIENAEKIVKELFKVEQVRVRDHEKIARIEIGTDEFGKMFDSNKLKILNSKLREIGFQYVTLDLAGYKSGNLVVIE